MDNRSHDGATPAERDTYNVGYCIYGGGTCNAGAALDPGAQFLASSKLASTEDVYFTTDASVDANVYLTITAIDDALGWYATTDPSTIHWINTAAATGEFYFTPGGSFGLAMNTADAQTDKKGILQGTTYYSQDVYGTTDHDESHFAFFSTPAPEPGMMGLVGAGLLVAGSIFRRKKHTQN